MSDQMNPGAFRVMCDMCGVDDTIKAAKRMGVTIPDDTIQEQREREQEVQARWDRVVKDVMRDDP